MLAAVMIAAAIQASAPADAHALDGNYVAEAKADGVCTFDAQWAFTVNGPSLQGQITNSGGVYPVAGLVDRNGRAIVLIGDFWGVAQFQNGGFTADYANNCGARHAIGARSAPAPGRH